MARRNATRRAVEAKRESRYVEFKEKFDVSSDGEWCELLKDFAAIANSGGGVIVVGRRDNGEASGANVTGVLALDAAVLTDKLFKYTGLHHDGFQIHEVPFDGHQLAAIEIDAAETPLIFARAGTYLDSVTRKQKSAFGQGTMYFRHGAKSEPATSVDLRMFIDRRIEADRRSLLNNIQKVAKAPSDAQIAIYDRTGTGTVATPTRVQLTMDEGAPVSVASHQIRLTRIGKRKSRMR